MASKKRNKRRGRKQHREAVVVPTKTITRDEAIAMYPDREGAAVHETAAGSIPAPEPDPRAHLEAARELMLKAKGYADRPSRRGHIERLLCKNFQQRPAIKNTTEYDRNFERIFGKKRQPVEYGPRDGYVVKPYQGSVLPEELDFGHHNDTDPNADPVSE